VVDCYIVLTPSGHPVLSVGGQHPRQWSTRRAANLAAERMNATARDFRTPTGYRAVYGPTHAA